LSTARQRTSITRVEVFVMVTCQSVGSRVSVMIAVAVLAAMGVVPAAAQTPSPLEQAVKVAATAAASATPATGEPQAPAAPAAPAENPVLTFFKGTELMGFVDTYYSYNFNAPRPACSTVGDVAGASFVLAPLVLKEPVVLTVLWGTRKIQKAERAIHLEPPSIAPNDDGIVTQS
jgi:hypothetical protein